MKQEYYFIILFFSNTSLCSCNGSEIVITKEHVMYSKKYYENV